MRARCHARARLRGSRCLPVADRAPVGVLGLRGDRALGVAGLPVAGAVAGADLALARRCSGGELELSDLAARQRGLSEGVVLLARELAPEATRELARGGCRTFRLPSRPRIASPNIGPVQGF
jgi:hypothetical protein